MDSNGSGGKPIPSPDALLTVVQAAEQVGVPISAIRREMEAGRLRHEVLRQGEREVQRIRWVDLADLFGPSQADAPSPPEPHPDETLSDEIQTNGAQPAFNPESTPEPASKSPSPGNELVTGADPLAAAGRESGFLVLREQQEELREQCFALRHRLTQAELERQRTVDALIQMQERLMLLQGEESGGLGSSLWKRPGTWAGAALLLAMVLWLRGSMESLQESLHTGQAQWGESLGRDTSERVAFYANRSDAERKALAERMGTWQEQQAQSDAEQVELLEGESRKRSALEASLQQSFSALRSETQASGELLQSAIQESGQALEDRRRAEQQSLLGSLAELRDQVQAQGSAQEGWRDQLDSTWREREKRALVETKRLQAQIEGLANSANDVQAWKAQATQANAQNAVLRRQVSTSISRQWIEGTRKWLGSWLPKKLR